MAQYEYVAVRVTGGSSKTGDRQVTDQINAVAMRGWRVVQVLDHGALVLFEREKQ